MKNVLLFCIMCLTSQPLLSYNGRLLDFEADGFVTGIRMGRPISPTEIVRDLSFIDEKETDLFTEYRKKSTFSSKEGPNDPELRVFYHLCREIYVGHQEINEAAGEDLFLPTMIAVQMLYERVVQLYRKYEQDSIIPVEESQKPSLPKKRPPETENRIAIPNGKKHAIVKSEI